jgi:hypothetical protein
MKRRRAVLLAAGAAAAAAAIALPLLLIGGDEPRLSAAQYSRRVTAVFDAVGQQFRLAGAGGSPRETSASLRTMKAALDEAATELGRLSPPKRAEGDHEALVEATGDYAAQVDLLRASVDFGDPATIANHLRDVTAPHAINRVVRELRAKGYPIRVRIAAPR